MPSGAQGLYRTKLKTPREAVALVRSEDSLAVPIATGQPAAFLSALDPAIIRRNRSMVSINGAIAVDLSGQVMADTIGPRQYSGVGGHELFVIGASASAGGKSILCLHSSAMLDGKRVSSIVASLPAGTAITTPRHHVQYVVTEYGVAHLAMLTARERAAALIGIAHPDCRGELEAALAVDGTQPAR